MIVFGFLEYRAKLYSRLENRRKKKELREIREQARPLQEMKVIISYVFIRDNELLCSVLPRICLFYCMGVSF